MYVDKNAQLDVIIPIAMEQDWPTYESFVEVILEQHENYGFTCFALNFPCGGWRSIGFPPEKVFEEGARLFDRVKQALKTYDLTLGWWLGATIKSGRNEEFQPMIRADGNETPFSSCPLDKSYQKAVAKRVALFAEIAKPSFIMLEDDYSISASTFSEGCFCPLHLKLFNEMTGRNDTREELNKIFARKNDESYTLLRIFRETSRRALVEFATAIRQAVDKKTPEISIGLCQSGSLDQDGDATFAVANALAGPNHRPWSRIYGAFYGKGDVASIPTEMFNALYCKQHITGDFHFIHESDSFPHTRFFQASSNMRAMMGAAYSFGYDGSVFQVQQILDDPNEEKAFSSMFAKERIRFYEVSKIAKRCAVKGVELCFDPFWNAQQGYHKYPTWLNCIGAFGIPYTSEEAPVAFWDERQAKNADHDTIMKYLAKGLFLDGDGAKALCLRGYSKYLGIEIGDEASTGKQSYDLAEREVICDGFVKHIKGRHMPSAHMFNPDGTGKLYAINVIDPQCQVVTEEYSFQKNFICNAMTRFENELGGRVVVMGMTLKDNHSHSLLNYRRQALFGELLDWCDAGVAYVKNEPRIFTIMNEAIDKSSELVGMLTLTNLSSDAIGQLRIHLPENWITDTSFSILSQEGKWEKVSCSVEKNELLVHTPFPYLEPVYLIAHRV